MFEAVKVALDPTPEQERRLLSHAGGARFAYNTMLDRVKAALDAGEKLDWSFYSLRKRYKHTTWLAKEYSDVSIEDLHVAGMVKNHHLAKAVSDAAFGEFRRQLEYKAARSGAALRVVDRWFPSSKTCSNCGAVKAKLSLSERTFNCDACGLSMDRDLNAAINIEVAGGAPETINAHGETARRSDRSSGHATRVAVKCEPSLRGGRRAVRLGADSRKAVLQTN